MKPEAHGHSYVIRCTVAAFISLPDETGPEIGACSKSRMPGGALAVRRREAIDGGSCVTHYPAIFTDESGADLEPQPH